ncbi:MAG: hypothetical protein ACKVX7_16260 [Planctomycetota bacterium]
MKLFGSLLVSLCLASAPAFAGTPQLIRGECNGDGLFNIADGIALLGFLFPAGPPPVLGCEDACDGNDDGALNIADVVTILNALFVPGSPPIPAPHPSCGADPTVDALDCAIDTPTCPPPGGSLPITLIAQGSFSGLPNGDFLATTSQTWGMLWTQHSSGVTPPPPVPPIDFTTDMVIGSIRDYGPGSTLTFISVDALPGFVVASLEVEQCPSPLPVVTMPFVFISVPLTPGALDVEESLAVPPCP